VALHRYISGTLPLSDECTRALTLPPFAGHESRTKKSICFLLYSTGTKLIGILCYKQHALLNTSHDVSRGVCLCVAVMRWLRLRFDDLSKVIKVAVT